jgi:membrane protein YqaA with SNARE-associated domain
VLGVLDSSYLFAPWGNDLLVIAMTARHPSVGNVFYYAAMSTAGSVLGALLIDVTLRPLGAAGLERHLSRRRLEQVRKKVGRSAGRALAVASLAPPPFPFTAFVMAAAALQYSRRRLAAIIGATRMLRFVVLGLLALRFGRRILKWAEIPAVQVVLIALIVVCAAGSIVSVYGWIRRSKKARG